MVANNTTIISINFKIISLYIVGSIKFIPFEQNWGNKPFSSIVINTRVVKSER